MSDETSRVGSDLRITHFPIAASANGRTLSLEEPERCGDEIGIEGKRGRHMAASHDEKIDVIHETDVATLFAGLHRAGHFCSATTMVVSPPSRFQIDPTVRYEQS
jgi:hypothetical protein